MIPFAPSPHLHSMSLRHLPRQPERERAHETTPATHPHNIVTHSSHAQPHPHLNGGNTIPSTPGGLSNGSNAIVSPAGGNTTIPNGVPSTPSIIHKLNVANEQTWLLIGKRPTFVQGNAVQPTLGQDGLPSKWATLNMRYPHMKMRCGTIRCPCLGLPRWQVLLGSRKIIPR